MFENENLVTEEVTENVEQTTEENLEQVETPPVKTYTEDDLNRIVGKRLARQEAKLRKEYDGKYGKLEKVMTTGTGEKDVGKIADTFMNYYQSKGIKFPEETAYSDRDIETLAMKDADEIIEYGYEDVVEEVDRLANIGTANMTPREQVMFKRLAEYRQNAERGKELAKLGVTKDVAESKKFKEFAAQFNSTTPITEIYKIFNKMQPKKEVQTMGSMKNGQNSKVKDFYTQEEIERLTEADLDNEDVWNAVRRSMTGKS